MPTIKISVPGNPVALKRHRVRKYGGNYDPSENDKGDFLAKCMAHRPRKPIDTAISLDIACHFMRPKSHYRTGKYAGELKPNVPIVHTNTPDWDNLGKFVGDALNGIFWTDDKLITDAVVYKRYSDTPRVELIIEY